MIIAIQSAIIADRELKIQVDPYATNLLADDLKIVSPTSYQIASRQSSPPKMFTGGTADLPAFTASGADPKSLLQLPALTRHYAATLPTMAAFAAFFEISADDPFARTNTDGLWTAIQRMRGWATGAWRSEQTQAAQSASAASTGELGYALLFGGSPSQAAAAQPQVLPAPARRPSNSALTVNEIRARARQRITARADVQREGN